MELAGVDVPVEPSDHRARPGAADRPLNGVLRSTAGLAPLRSWEDALADYLERAGLLAGAPA